jgi:hypothetical protein
MRMRMRTYAPRTPLGERRQEKKNGKTARG